MINKAGTIKSLVRSTKFCNSGNYYNRKSTTGTTIVVIEANYASKNEQNRCYPETRILIMTNGGVYDEKYPSLGLVYPNSTKCLWSIPSPGRGI